MLGGLAVAAGVAWNAVSGGGPPPQLQQLPKVFTTTTTSSVTENPPSSSSSSSSSSFNKMNEVAERVKIQAEKREREIVATEQLRQGQELLKQKQQQQLQQEQQQIEASSKKQKDTVAKKINDKNGNGGTDQAVSSDFGRAIQKSVIGATGIGATVWVGSNVFRKKTFDDDGNEDMKNQNDQKIIGEVQTKTTDEKMKATTKTPPLSSAPASPSKSNSVEASAPVTTTTNTTSSKTKNPALINEIDDVLKDVEGVLDEVNTKLNVKDDDTDGRRVVVDDDDTKAEKDSVKENDIANKDEIISAILEAEMRQAERAAEQQREIIEKSEIEGTIDLDDSLLSLSPSEEEVVAKITATEPSSPSSSSSTPGGLGELDSVLGAELQAVKDLEAESDGAGAFVDVLGDPVSAFGVETILEAEMEAAKEEAKLQNEFLQADLSPKSQELATPGNVADILAAELDAARKEAKRQEEIIQAEKEVEEEKAKAAEEDRRKKEEEEKAKATEKLRIDTERQKVEKERIEAEKAAEEARLEVERQKAEMRRLEEEQAAKEKARLDAERQKAEEEARLEAERIAAVKAAEEARLEAERLKAEEEARLEAERIAAEEKAAKEARLKAEEEARLEAERIAAEEKAAEEARLEAERIEAEKAAEEARIKAIEAAEAQRVASIIKRRENSLKLSLQQLEDEEESLLKMLSGERIRLLKQQEILADQRSQAIRRHEKAVAARVKAQEEARLKALAEAQEAKRAALVESKIQLERQEKKLLDVLSSQNESLSKEEISLADVRVKAIQKHQLEMEEKQKAEAAARIEAVNEARAADLLASEKKVLSDMEKLLSTLSNENTGLLKTEKILADARSRLVGEAIAAEQARLEEERKLQEMKRLKAEREMERVQRDLLTARLTAEQNALKAEQQRLQAAADEAKRVELQILREEEEKKEQARRNASYEARSEATRRSLLSFRLQEQTKASLAEKTIAKAIEAVINERSADKAAADLQLESLTSKLLTTLSVTNDLIREEERILAEDWTAYVTEYQRVLQEEEEEDEEEIDDADNVESLASDKNSRIAELERLEAELLEELGDIDDDSVIPTANRIEIDEDESVLADLSSAQADSEGDASVDVNARLKELEKLEAQLEGSDDNDNDESDDAVVVVDPTSDNDDSPSELTDRLQELDRLEAELLAEDDADDDEDIPVDYLPEPVMETGYDDDDGDDDEEIFENYTKDMKLTPGDVQVAESTPDERETVEEVVSDTAAETIRKADDMFVPTDEALNSVDLLLEQVTGRTSMADYTGKDGIFTGRNVAVQPGSSLSVPIKVSTPGTFVEYRIEKKAYDFGFGISAFLDDDNSMLTVKEMSPFGREPLVQDKVLVGAGFTPCTLQFKFENNKRTMLEKVQLTYLVHVIPPSPALAREGRRRRARAAISILDDDIVKLKEQRSKSSIRIPTLQSEVDELTKALQENMAALQSVMAEEKALRKALGIADNAVVKFNSSQRGMGAAGSDGIIRPNEP